MKTQVLQYFMIVLTVVILSQMTASTYVNLKTVCNIETPFEEAADEDTDGQEETDKLFQSIAIENTDLSYSVTHHSFFEANLSEHIREIVPPPPKG